MDVLPVEETAKGRETLGVLQAVLVGEGQVVAKGIAKLVPVDEYQVRVARLEHPIESPSDGRFPRAREADEPDYHGGGLDDVLNGNGGAGSRRVNRVARVPPLLATPSSAVLGLRTKPISVPRRWSSPRPRDSGLWPDATGPPAIDASGGICHLPSRSIAAVERFPCLVDTNIIIPFEIFGQRKFF